MAWKKAVVPPPPKDQIVVETKIIKTGEKPRRVKTLNKQILEIYNNETKSWEKFDPIATYTSPSNKQDDVRPLEDVVQEQKEDVTNLLDNSAPSLLQTPTKDIEDKMEVSLKDGI